MKRVTRIRQAFVALGLTLAAYPSLLQAGCDPCMQANALAASSTMNAALAGVTASVQGNVAATTALNATIGAANVAITTTIELNNKLLMTALTGAANRMSLAVEQNTKMAENMGNFTVATMANSIKEATIAEQVDANNRIYSNTLSQPLSGEIGANRAPLLKTGMVQSAQVWRKMADDMYEWSNSIKPGEGRWSIRKAVLVTEDEDVWNPVPLITGNQLTKKESLNMQKLITMLVNPSPAPSLSDNTRRTGSGGNEYEFKRRIKNAKLGLAHSVLAKSIADRQPLVSVSTDDWQKGYVMVAPDEDGKVSVLSVLESETIGRLGSEGWFLDIKTKTPAGILREQVYQQAINNQLLLRMVQQEEQKLAMLALMAVSKINGGR